MCLNQKLNQILFQKNMKMRLNKNSNKLKSVLYQIQKLIIEDIVAKLIQHII